MNRYDTIIKGGCIIDGLRNPRLEGDIGIKDGRIAAIGSLDPDDAQAVLEADDHIVGPGFIDLHTHYDSQLFWDPYCGSSAWHGVTTVVSGNCGYGVAPCRADDRDRTMLSLSRIGAISPAVMKEGMPWDWETFPEYIESVAKAPKAINVAINAPISPLMIWVMGRERAKAGVLPTDEEHHKMAQLLDEAMEAGAIGFSAQRFGMDTHHTDFDGTPLPTDLVHDETMLVLGEVLRKRDEGYIQNSYWHSRPSVEELARRSGRNVLAVAGPSADMFDWETSCRQRGLPIYCHSGTCGMRGDWARMSVTEGPSHLDWSRTWREATLGTPQRIKGELNAAHVRKHLREEWTASRVGAWILVRANAPANAKYENMSISEIATHRSGQSYVDIFLDLTIEGDLKSEWAIYANGSDDLEVFRRLTNHSNWVPGVSDGGAHTKGGHHTFYSTFFLMSYVRDHGWLSLEDAHYKLSALPAKIAGLEQKLGTLAVGAPADIVVYDLNKLSISESQKYQDMPANEWRFTTRGVGYRWILVNGRVIIDDDRETHTVPGRMVHSERYARRAAHAMS
jgi:N-acyl-D-aspartate/D-glutamate deacylase